MIFLKDSGDSGEKVHGDTKKKSSEINYVG